MLDLSKLSGNPATLHSALAFDSVLMALNVISPSPSSLKISQGLFSSGMTGTLKGSPGKDLETGDYVRLMLTPNQASHHGDGKRNNGAANDQDFLTDVKVSSSESPGLKIDVLQASPWLVDGVVRIKTNSFELNSEPTSAPPYGQSFKWEKVEGVGQGHTLTRGNFEDLAKDKSEWYLKSKYTSVE